METLTIEHANAMPAPTWHRLKMNDVDIELPSDLAFAQQVDVQCDEELLGDADAFDTALLSMAGSSPAAALPSAAGPSTVALPSSVASPSSAASPSSVAAQRLGDQPAACAADQGASPVEPASAPTTAAHQVDGQATLTAATEGGAAAHEFDDRAVLSPVTLPAASPSSVAAQRLGDQPAACAADQGVSPVEPASAPTTAAHQVDDQATLTAATVEEATAETYAAAIEEPALSTYQQEAFERLFLSPADVFVTGMGDEAREYLEFAAGDPLVFTTRPGERTCATVRVEGVNGAVNAAAIDVVAAPGSSLSLAIALDSPTPGTGVVGTRLRVFAAADARVDISCTQTLDDSWTALDDAGIVLGERARVTVRHTVLGAGRSYTGLDADVRGDDARLDLHTRYAGHAHQLRDFNYVAHQRGRRTVCNLDANGVLAGESQKTLRGTIELVHGCKGSTGSEQETVLLADERVVNRTVPVILCDEDDVAGNHGATIGHVRPEQLFYLASRGISPEDAERLFIAATYQEAALAAPDERTRAAVSRLAAARGIEIEEDVA